MIVTVSNPNYRPPVPKKRVTVILIKVKSRTALLCMLLMCISIYLKSYLRHKLLILDAYHLDRLFLCEHGCDNPWLFFKTKWGPWARQLGIHWFILFLASLATNGVLDICRECCLQYFRSSTSSIHSQTQSQNVGNLCRHLHNCLGIMIMCRHVLVLNKDDIDMPWYHAGFSHIFQNGNDSERLRWSSG